MLWIPPKMQWYETNKTRGGKSTNFKTRLAFFCFWSIFLFLGKPGSLELPISFYLNLI